MCGPTVGHAHKFHFVLELVQAFEHPFSSRLVIGPDFFNTVSTIVNDRLGNVIYIVAFTERSRLRTFAYGWHYRNNEYYDQEATFGYTDQFGR